MRHLFDQLCAAFAAPEHPQPPYAEVFHAIISGIYPSSEQLEYLLDHLERTP